jgi:hypothetical protein
VVKNYQRMAKKGNNPEAAGGISQGRLTRRTHSMKNLTRDIGDSGFIFTD